MRGGWGWVGLWWRVFFFWEGVGLACRGIWEGGKRSEVPRLDLSLDWGDGGGSESG